MAFMLADPDLQRELLEQRRRAGADKYDEVWDGVYVMHAYPGDEHQDIVGGLQHALREAIQVSGLGRVRPGVNIAADPSDWKRDYRCPDVVVFLNNTLAKCYDTFWTGGDFVVEVVSPGDESRNKIQFYSRVGVQELLIIDRDPWSLELFRSEKGMLVSVERVVTGEPAFESRSLSLSFGLVDDAERPFVIVTRPGDGMSWRV